MRYESAQSLQMDTTVYCFSEPRDSASRGAQQQANIDAKARAEAAVAWSLRHGPLTSVQIQHATGLGNSTVHRALGRLMKNDRQDRGDEPVVRCYKSGTNTLYALT